MDRKDLQTLSTIRLREATALLKAGYFDGAYYLAGYAVECALKTCIAKGTQRGEFPDRKKVESSHSHDLRKLVGIAGLDGVRARQFGEDTAFRNNWEIVELWTEQSRYQRHQPDSAQTLVAAVGDRQHGVISWIKRQW